MRELDPEIISQSVADLVQEANFNLGEDMIRALKKGKENEESPVGREIFAQIIENIKIASNEKVPICQDTGVAVIFLEIGRDLHINGDIYQAVNQGVKRGYQEGYLRKSMVVNPLNRENTGDNTPAVIHTKIVAGDKLKIIAAPKGGGSENMSTVKMLKPADGREGVKQLVLKTIADAGANPCPPIIVGIGLGGTIEKAALLSKEALLRPVEDLNPDPEIAQLEKELLSEINQLGIGPQGLGGRQTALAVKIETFACHIASLPVAINLNCHAARHKEVVL